MACCSRKQQKQQDEESGKTKNDLKSMKSVEEDEEEIDPDALHTGQVVVAVLLLCLFSLSFATSFFLMSPAINSLKADFDDQIYSCKIKAIIEDEKVACVGYKYRSPCINIMLDCDGFNENKVMYEYYQAYYTGPKCSKTRCREAEQPREDATGNRIKYPMELIRSCCTLNNSEHYEKTSYPAETDERDLYINMTFANATFYRDNNKPHAMFLQKDLAGTNKVVMGHGAAYVIIILPMLFMFGIGMLLVILFICNKLSAKEIYRPLTPITPMHKKIKGKWYLKEPNPTDKPKLNAFEKLQNIRKQQEEITAVTNPLPPKS